MNQSPKFYKNEKKRYKIICIVQIYSHKVQNQMPYLALIFKGFWQIKKICISTYGAL